MNRDEFVKDTVRYYSENTARRCSKDNACYYDPAILGLQDISEGCAIGRHLTPENKKRANNRATEHSIYAENPVASELPKDLMPEWMVALGDDFLDEVQTLHDNNDNWNTKGLTEKGENAVADIYRKFIDNAV